MKKYFIPVIAFALLLSAFTVVRFDGHGKITGSGAGLSFNVSGNDAFFTRTVDTVVIRATLSRKQNAKSDFYISVIASKPGTYELTDMSLNPAANLTSGGYVFYQYMDTNAVGTYIAHEFIIKKGTVNIKRISAQDIDASYNATIVDMNNNNDSPITVAGTFTGKF